MENENNDDGASDLDAQSDRFEEFFANEGNPSGNDPENEAEPDPVDDGTDGMDEPFLKDDPDYDPDELYDPDKAPKAEDEPDDQLDTDDDPKAEGDEADGEAEVEGDDPDVEGDEPDAVKGDEDWENFKSDVFKEIEENSNDPAAGKKWAALRFREKEAQRAVDELKSSAIDTPEMKELAAKAERVSEVEMALKDAQDKLALFDFQTTPEYKQEIEVPYKRVAETAANIETAASIPEGSILKAISVGNKETQDQNIQALVDSYNISARDINTIYNKADEMLSLTHKEADLRSTAQERLSESRAEQEAREAYMAEQEASVYRSNVHSTFKDYEGQIGAFLNEDGTNNDSWDEAIKDSEQLDFKNDPELQGLGAFALTAVPHLMKQNNEFAAEIAKLKAVANRNKAVKPPSVSRASSVKAPKARSNSHMSLSDAIGARLNAD